MNKPRIIWQGTQKILRNRHMDGGGVIELELRVIFDPDNRSLITEVKKFDVFNNPIWIKTNDNIIIAMGDWFTRHYCSLHTKVLIDLIKEDYNRPFVFGESHLPSNFSKLFKHKDNYVRAVIKNKKTCDIQFEIKTTDTLGNLQWTPFLDREILNKLIEEYIIFYASV